MWLICFKKNLRYVLIDETWHICGTSFFIRINNLFFAEESPHAQCFLHYLRQLVLWFRVHGRLLYILFRTITVIARLWRGGLWLVLGHWRSRLLMTQLVCLKVKDQKLCKARIQVFVCCYDLHEFSDLHLNGLVGCKRFGTKAEEIKNVYFVNCVTRINISCPNMAYLLQTAVEGCLVHPLHYKNISIWVPNFTKIEKNPKINLKSAWQIYFLSCEGSCVFWLVFS